MGEDAFSLLNLPRRLALSLEEIEASWRELSRDSHPDSESGDTRQAAAINSAYETLKHAGSRLRHWLELQDIEIPRNASLDDALMTQFGEVGAVLAKADAFLEKKKAATTAISKALIAGDEVETQLALQKQMATLKSQMEEIEGKFSDYENDPKAALHGLERLRFLEKWSAQCQERLIGIMM